MHVAIIGGGVIGCSIALRLSEAKAEVTVFERALPGAEASSAAAGILGAQAEADGNPAFLALCLKSRALYPDFARELEARAGMGIGYLRSGLLDVAFDEAGAQALAAAVQSQRAKGLEAELLTAEGARELEPSISEKILAAAHFPDDHQVDNRLLVRALSIAATRAGVRFRSGLVRGVARENDRAIGVDLEGERVHADAVVVAAGAWTGLVGNAGIDAQAVRPLKGQMVCLQTRAPLFHHILFAKHRYLVPRADGRVIAGSTMELTGFDKQVSARGVAEILQHALELCPELETAALVETWAGLRPLTEDRLPILGKGPLEGLFLASGHYRNGILLTPVTARLLADCVLGRTPEVDLSPYRYDRFPRSA